MQPTKDIERLLSETPLPTVRDSRHRADLKQGLLAEMQYERRTLWRGVLRPQWLAAAAAVVVLAVGGAKYLANFTSDRPIAAVSSRPATTGKTDVSLAARPEPARVMREGLGGTLEQDMNRCPVIVLATALDSAPAAPRQPGDAAENLIRWRIQRVLKGRLNQEFVTTQTPTAAGEFIGKDWVLLLSPDFLAGKHRYAQCVRADPNIQAMAVANAAAAAPAPVAVAPAARNTDLRRKSLDQCVAQAQVIVVATALDSAPAAPKVRGDVPENLIRFRVARVLKGQLTQEIITTRTPTAAAEFIGHDWVVMLSPEYVAGKHLFAGCYTIKLEPEVKAIVAKGAK